MFKNQVYPEIIDTFSYFGEEIEYVITGCNFSEQIEFFYVLVPGIFGDRCDSRSFFVRLARSFAENNMSCIRFDYIGSGYSSGNYATNNFDRFIETLDYLLNTIKNRFKNKNIQFCLISMSEAAKISMKVSNNRQDVCSVIFCNGLLVEEEMNSIERPKLRNNQLVYDSKYGVWTNFEFVENYAKYYIDEREFNKDIQYYGLYGSLDNLTLNSKKLLEKMCVPIVEIEAGDHLFLKKETFELAINSLKEISEIVCIPKIQNTKQYIKYIVHDEIVNLLFKKNNSKKIVIFIPGLFQTATGAGFLFKDIADFFGENYDYLFIDLPGQGESSGTIMKNLTLYVELVRKIFEEIKSAERYTEIISIANGIGNHILNEISCNKRIFLAPQKSDICALISNMEVQKDYIDTHSIYCIDEGRADYEIRKIGNIRNRSSGVSVPIELLQNIDNHEMIFTEMDIIFNNDDCLYMSAVTRERLINSLSKVLYKAEGHIDERIN